jgi:hypothetical protein
MKHLLLLTLLITCLIPNLAFAETTTNTESLNQCIQGCIDSEANNTTDSNRTIRRSCTNYCENEFPAVEEPSRRDQINQCKEDNDCSSKEGAEKRTCNNQCEEQYQATDPESGNNEVLPPIIKPSLLPGPTFGDANNRTGQEVTGYVTEKLLPKVASRLLTIMSVSSLLGLMYAGVQFYMALGDPEKMGQAKRAAIFSVIGLILALLSFSIVQIINLLPL